MRILFIAFHFPPLSAAGVQRPVYFARYLHEYGIETVVITTDADGFELCMPGWPHDESLLDELPESLVIERVPLRPSKAVRKGRLAQWRRIFFSLVEHEADMWSSQLDRLLPGLIKKHNPAAVLVTLPPFFMASVGCQIAKRYDLPLILDFRDAWSQWRVGPYGSWVHYWLIRRLEGKCLRAASHVICTSTQMRDDFLRVHPGISADKFSVITNGYDEVLTGRPSVTTKAGGEFRIGYVGGFYYSPQARDAMMRPWWRKRLNRMIQYAPRKEDWLYRSPFFFFRAVKLLLERRPELRQRLRIRFAGEKPDWIDEQVGEFGLGDVVEFVGWLDHPAVLRFQRECDALLITSSKVIGGRDYSIAGKTFEYFSMMKPIIGFVAEGAQRDLLAASGMALICDPDAPAAAAEHLCDLIEGRFKPTPDMGMLKQLHRRELAKRLAGAITALAT